MGEKKYASQIKRVSKQKDITKKISSNPAAIGYCNLQEVTSKLLALSVSFDSSKTFIAPTEFNFQSNAYPISRAFYFYAASSKEAEMKLFMDYTKSLLGRRNIREMGFIPAQ
jgi:phosphate transport system substrate-binding protein